ncbi:holo-ACP synthase [Corynebacterium ulceribovis]|uniref:holo-ACP synthase AcpS n=1 Tax=Corynebacterium ulceribovis TaxID=487732 RepID=UPI000685401D|nr:holo-ACP synthase [Corynebacterium ulceribovis]
MILGVGVDLVDISTFEEQLAAPGTTFGAAFTTQERLTSKLRAEVSGSIASHMAGRWAAKEAFVKAWSAALIGTPPPLSVEDMVWPAVEVRADTWGRPLLHIHQPLASHVAESLMQHCAGSLPRMHLSMSHDGRFATATVVLSA